LLAAGAAALLAAAGCAGSGTAPVGTAPDGSDGSDGSDGVVVVDTVYVTTASSADAGLEARVGRLEIMLLEGDARLLQLRRELDATRQEVVRNLAKLQSQASRAEAASGMAEAELAVQTLGRMAGGTELSEYTEARSRVTESSTEFGSENYGGSLYLATQARTLARGGQARLSDVGRSSRQTGETLFAVPIPLRTEAQRANVREGPGLGFDVRFTLEPSTPVTGQSYTGEWIHVVDERGRQGWVFHTLITGRDLR
jgi:hypothetical protein